MTLNGRETLELSGWHGCLPSCYQPEKLIQVTRFQSLDCLMIDWKVLGKAQSRKCHKVVDWTLPQEVSHVHTDESEKLRLSFAFLLFPL